jgi:IrrE N-terminal-like domain
VSWTSWWTRMSDVYQSPDALLHELGISSPELIDIEAIAQYCAATIVYEPLQGSVARIIGYRDRAIITVDSDSPRPRQRFSGAHELGHWMADRGGVSHFVCSEKQLASEWSRNNPETRANRFAGGLLLPTEMFREDARNCDVTFAVVGSLANRYQTSLTATAIRLVELGSFPSMLISFQRGSKRWEWHMRSPMVPKELWPADLPSSEALAYDLLQGSSDCAPCEVGSWGWFEHPDADRFSVHEDSIRVMDRVLSLLWWKDESQLLELAGDDE